MGEDFKKLGCYAKKVIIEKTDDETLVICVEDTNGDEHNLKAKVIVENFQNIDTFGDKEEYTIDVASLNIDYSLKKTKKLDSKNISMKWNHTSKPSVYEIKNKDKIVFTGTFSDAMIWVNNNIKECDQKIVTKKSLH